MEYSKSNYFKLRNTHKFYMRGSKVWKRIDDVPKYIIDETISYGTSTNYVRITGEKDE